MSFLLNDAVSDTTEVELCTGADTIKQKYVSFVLVDLQK